MSAIAEQARAVSGTAGAITSQLMGVGGGMFDRYRAAFAGLRAGAGALGWFRSRNGSPQSEHPRTEPYTRAEAFDDLHE